MKEDFVRMIPPSIPWPRASVYFTGVCEIAGAVGLLLPEFRRAAAYALIAFFLAVLPAVQFTVPFENYRHQHQTPRTEGGIKYGDFEKHLNFQGASLAAWDGR